MIRPTLREKQGGWRLADYPEGTYFEAGYLVQKNAGWRLERPVLDAGRCTGCGQCYLYCPDGVIAAHEGGIGIDYDFCKGCGICARVCKFHAITMEAER